LLRSWSALRCRTLGQSRPRLAGLVPPMGKASVSNITVLSRSRRRPKSPCYGPFVGCGSPARDPSSTPLPVPSAGTVLPHKLAPYCWNSSPSWHPTAPPPPAGTLLLSTGWHPTAHHRWLATPLPGGPARPPASLPPAIYSTVANLA